MLRPFAIYRSSKKCVVLVLLTNEVEIAESGRAALEYGIRRYLAIHPVMRTKCLVNQGPSAEESRDEGGIADR